MTDEIKAKIQRHLEDIENEAIKAVVDLNSGRPEVLKDRMLGIELSLDDVDRLLKSE